MHSDLIDTLRNESFPLFWYGEPVGAVCQYQGFWCAIASLPSGTTFYDVFDTVEEAGAWVKTKVLH